MSELSTILRKGLTPAEAKQGAAGNGSNSEVAALQQQVQELTNLVKTLQGSKQEVPTAPVRPGGKTFISYRELADAMDSPKAMAELLNAALAEIAEQRTSASVNVERVQEELLQKLNATLDDRIAVTVTTNSAIADFYRENPEFVPFKYQAGVIVSELQSENPNWSIDQLLNKTKEVMLEKHGDLIEAAKSVSKQNDTEAGDKGDKATGKKLPTQPDGGEGAAGAGEVNDNPIAAMVARYKKPVEPVAE